MNNPFEIIDNRLRNIEALLLEIIQYVRGSSRAHLSETGGIELAQEITRLSKTRIYALVSARQIRETGKQIILHSLRVAGVDSGRQSHQGCDPGLTGRIWTCVMQLCGIPWLQDREFLFFP
jgi:hypothetical protein